MTSIDLSRIRHVVLDMDGTIYKGSRLFPCTPPFLERLRTLGIGCTFLTNNSSRSRVDYIEKLRKMGIPCDPGQIYTSADCTIDYLRAEFPDAKRLAILGTPSLCREFESAGFTPDWEAPQAVVVGFDTTLDYKRLCRAAWWIEKGLPFIATHPDWICPTDEPTVLVDCGAICACLSAATGGKQPVVLGKPAPAMLEQVCVRHSLETFEIVMVGDRLYTDMAMAHQAGALAVLVLTGEATKEEALAMTPPPDLVLADVGVLGEMLAAAQPEELQKL
jgi:NagD protein